MWVACSFLTLLFYGIANFLSSVIGKEAADAPQAGRSNGQAQLLMEAAVGVVLACTVVVLRGMSKFKDARSTAAMLVSGVIMATGVLTLAIALASDFRMAPFITGVLPFNAVFLVVACRVFLGERTSSRAIVAIAVAVVGLAIMATADTSSEGLKGILFGLIVALCFAAGNFGIKYASLRGHVDHLTAVSLLWLAMGVVGIVFFTVESIANGLCFAGLDTLNDTWGGGASNRLHWFAVFSALFQTLAVGFMKLAVSLGPAAPAMAIANANSIIVLALNQFFFHPEVKLQQIIGLCISIAGVGALSIAPRSAEVEGLSFWFQGSDSQTP